MSYQNSKFKNQNFSFKVKSIIIFGFILAPLNFSLCLLPSQQTFAQSNSNITVSPQLIQLDLSKDKPEAKYTYTNNSSQTIELQLSMQDVKELEDRGVPGLIDPNVTKDYNFGLSDWARFSNTDLVIAPGESKSVTVFIDKSRLTLGGHYGTILAELVQKDDQKAVKLRAILSTLLFVRSGSEYEQERANIVEINNNSTLFSFPKIVSFRLQNTGNVDLTPYGILTITSPFGHEVARGIINEDSLIALPDSTRRYIVKINRYADVLPPGIYKTNLEVRYGKNRFKLAESSYFFILSENLLLTLTVILILIGAGLFIVLRRRKR